VLDARAGLSFAGTDVYLNVAGGLRITEPAADLAVAMALVSAQMNRPLDPKAVVFGEISLSGALRPVSQTENRLKEAGKLGFTRAILPVLPKRAAAMGLDLTERADLAAAVMDQIGAEG
jgi:DNA repair protein RadA/Sms